MKLYAERPGRFCRQLIGDVLCLVVIVSALMAGSAIKQRTLGARDGATQLQKSASNLRGNLESLSHAAQQIPLGGDVIAKPVTDAAATAGDISNSGKNLADGLQQTADVLGYAVSITPIVLVLVVWFLTRGRWVRLATRADALRTSAAGRRLLALEALRTVSPVRLLGIHDDPGSAWAAGDDEVAASLAALHLKSLGLKSRAAEGRPGDGKEPKGHRGHASQPRDKKQAPNARTKTPTNRPASADAPWLRGASSEAKGATKRDAADDADATLEA